MGETLNQLVQLRSDGMGLRPALAHEYQFLGNVDEGHAFTSASIDFEPEEVLGGQIDEFDLRDWNHLGIETVFHAFALLEVFLLFRSTKDQHLVEDVEDHFLSLARLARRIDLKDDLPDELPLLVQQLILNVNLLFPRKKVILSLFLEGEIKYVHLNLQYIVGFQRLDG